MARKPKGLTKPIAKTAARMSRKAALTPTQLEKIDAYWRASNYLAACQLYLLDNPLLKKPLEPAQNKKKKGACRSKRTSGAKTRHTGPGRNLLCPAVSIE